MLIFNTTNPTQSIATIDSLLNIRGKRLCNHSLPPSSMLQTHQVFRCVSERKSSPSIKMKRLGTRFKFAAVFIKCTNPDRAPPPPMVAYTKQTYDPHASVKIAQLKTEKMARSSQKSPKHFYQSQISIAHF